MNIITNNQPRQPMSGLTLELFVGDKKAAEIREQFDYLSDTEFEDTSFITYKGYTYCLGDFMRTPSACDEFNGWDGYHSESFFSGILIKFTEDHDVILGRYFS